MGKHYKKRKKLLSKTHIKAVLEWLAIITTIAANIYNVLRK